MKSLKFCFLLVLALVSLFDPSSLATHAYSSTPCNGWIAECNEENEQLMESEISRRFLAQQKSISYGALKPNRPACDSGARGQDYRSSEGCLPPPANPPNRGCPKYYRCRSGS
ncbi:protein RALF-like 32 [Alnus glutinosa]|uniref:protein RALF-like 32 n=1 Tax=Alnus glutinosa TaxID=3517 RepID=UPI002D771117|nr:protein RALF-like 32 [Alnus glutinosa]